jgi:hypothetical protein
VRTEEVIGTDEAGRGGLVPREGAAVVGRGRGVIEDGLLAEGHAEDLAQDFRGLMGCEGNGDVKGQEGVAMKEGNW